MSTGFLSGVDEWGILVSLLVLLLAACEVGFRLGRNAESRTQGIMKSQTSIAAAGILGILSLLLGFTMSMEVSRFEVRKQLVLDEANAIGTSYLRTQLLPARESAEMTDLLRLYVDIRLKYGDAVDFDRLEDQGIRMQAIRLQGEFWPRAVSYARKDPNAVRTGLLLQSLNQAIDLESARWMAFLNHVPESVIYANAVVALLAMSLVGYIFGGGGWRPIFSMCVLALAITVVLGVIIDLDRPRRGFIRVSQQPMIDLQHQLQTSK